MDYLSMGAIGSDPVHAPRKARVAVQRIRYRKIRKSPYHRPHMKRHKPTADLETVFRAYWKEEKVLLQKYFGNKLSKIKSHWWNHVCHLREENDPSCTSRKSGLDYFDWWHQRLAEHRKEQEERWRNHSDPAWIRAHIATIDPTSKYAIEHWEKRLKALEEGMPPPL